jgi:hypothetical protein
MRRLLSLNCLGVALFLLSGSVAFATDAPIPEMRESIVLLTSPRSQYVEGAIIADTIKSLRALSPTFDEMIKVLGVSRILTLISPAPKLDIEKGLIGQTRFFVGPAKVVAIVQVVTAYDNPTRRREAIAHELAHIVEVACLGPISSVAELQERIQTQMVRFSDRRPGRVIETRFPTRVARVVLEEARRRRGGPSQLGELLFRDGLMSCPETLPGHEVEIVQRAQREADLASR